MVDELDLRIQIPHEITGDNPSLEVILPQDKQDLLVGGPLDPINEHTKRYYRTSGHHFVLGRVETTNTLNPLHKIETIVRCWEPGTHHDSKATIPFSFSIRTNLELEADTYIGNEIGAKLLGVLEEAFPTTTMIDHPDGRRAISVNTGSGVFLITIGYNNRESELQYLRKTRTEARRIHNGTPMEERSRKTFPVMRSAEIAFDNLYQGPKTDATVIGITEGKESAEDQAVNRSDHYRFITMEEVEKRFVAHARVVEVAASGLTQALSDKEVSPIELKWQYPPANW